MFALSSYDSIYTEARTEGSLHYLDMEAGELVHPGEYAQKQKSNEQRKAFEKLCKEEQANWSQKVAAESSREKSHEPLPESTVTRPALKKMLFVCTVCGNTFGMRNVSHADCANQTCLCRTCAGLPARKAEG